PPPARQVHADHVTGGDSGRRERGGDTPGTLVEGRVVECAVAVYDRRTFRMGRHLLAEQGGEGAGGYGAPLDVLAPESRRYPVGYRDAPRRCPCLRHTVNSHGLPGSTHARRINAARKRGSAAGPMRSVQHGTEDEGPDGPDAVPRRCMVSTVAAES